ncbi:butyrophilin-like protein 1 isoform X2 [Gouania willdenowi]|uniref:butyrophilin-like protein 1 isoform X2 n=1 Tax=Gouania willdenowi TaxID=441366 RepID=UPI0010565631|nr:butyrophilin-like protein 1 isoform X2 [Gouania willdenowi]
MELLCLLSACVFSVLGLSAAAEAEKLVKKEDEDVVLPCSVPFSVTDQLFDWKKVSHSDIFHYQKGTYNNFRGPVFHFEDELESGNASVVIRKAQVTDSGNYTCNFPNHPPMEKAHIDLTVGAARWPVISLHKATNGILLKCRVLGAFPKPEVRWLDSSGNVLLPDEDPQVSYRDHHYDVVLKTTVTESGHYSCEATQREIHHRNQTETYVLTPGPLVPLTTQHKATNGILLKCRVLGAFPKPEVRWLDSSGNVLLPDEDPQVSYRDHHYDVVLKTTVTESGHYSCEATQREIHHRNQTETYVSVPGALVTPPEKPTGVIVGVIGIVIGIVIGVIGIIAGVCFAKRHKGRHGTANGHPDAPQLIPLT